MMMENASHDFVMGYQEDLIHQMGRQIVLQLR
ncbi:unnamed protein product [Schistosoma curassoni]|uniref:Alpha/beta hydrolase n=1 Tax=Schistosoma curassoni TaxID=6186 RepID=A0A183KJQ8_9TREM|nr:unnamed protein product [Schistosoma curassoni]